MSHYCVAVIVDEPTEEAVEKVLAPYDENMEVEPYIRRTKEEIIKEGMEWKEKIIKKMEDPNYELDDWEQKYYNCQTDEDFYQAERYEDFDYDEDGNELSTYNPNSKWDWWTLQGRFGTNGKFIQLKDFIVERNLSEEERQTLKREWEIFVENSEPTNEKEEEIKKWNFYSDKYYLDRYGTKENYIYTHSLIIPYALVDDEHWYSQGEMGWFGMDDSTSDSLQQFIKLYINYIKNVKNINKYLVFADLHI